MQQISQIMSLTAPILIPGIVLILILKTGRLKFLDLPLDFNQTINQKRVFGANKTAKGVCVMFVASVITSYALYIGALNGNPHISTIFLNHPFFIGTIYSFSYTLGELINSFTKRRLGIQSGKATNSRFKNIQLFFDLSDGIIVTVIMLLILTSVTASYAIIAGLIGIFLHFLTDLLMKRLSLK